MGFYPYHLLSRPYAAGYPKWPPLESGVAAMRLGRGVLRTRDEFGQCLWAIDIRQEAMTQADAAILNAFLLAHRTGAFYWSDVGLGPLASGLYETWSVQIDPDTWPAVEPNAEIRTRYDAAVRLLPVVPTVAVAMLVAWWTLDEGGGVLAVGDDEALEVGTDEVLSLGGTEIIDSSGNGHTGTSSQDSSTMAAEGKVGGALDFNGTSDYVAVADAAALRLTSGGSIAAWIKPDGLGESSEGRIVDKSTAVDAAGGYAFALAAGNRLAFRVASDNEWTLSSASAITLSAWHHVAVSFDDYGRKLWVDGEDVTDTGGALTRLPPTSTAGLRIGNRAGATDRSFNGVIDDVRIYARPLCQQEVRALWNEGSGTAEEVIA